MRMRANGETFYGTYLPWPPTLNTYYRAINGRNILSKKGRAYKDEAMKMVMDWGLEGMPLKGRIRLLVKMFPPDRRKRDLDNCLKAMLDALTGAGVWKDDSQIDSIIVLRMAPIPPRGHVVVFFEEYDGCNPDLLCFPELAVSPIRMP